MVYRFDGIARPPPMALSAPQPAVAELAGQLSDATVAETREKLIAFLAETRRVGVDLEGRLVEMEGRVGQCSDTSSLCAFMLDLESVYCHAGEGLPRGAIAACCCRTACCCCCSQLLLAAVLCWCAMKVRRAQGCSLCWQQTTPNVRPHALCPLTPLPPLHRC